MYAGLGRPVHRRTSTETTKLLTNSPGLKHVFEQARCSIHCGSTETRPKHNAMLGPTWVQKEGTWKRVRLSEYAGGYTETFAKNILQGTLNDLESGVYVTSEEMREKRRHMDSQEAEVLPMKQKQRREQFERKRALQESAEVPWFTRPQEEESADKYRRVYEEEDEEWQ